MTTTDTKQFACALCPSGSDTARGLSAHLQHTHKLTSKDYTIQVVYNGTMPLCLNCQSPEVRYTNFSFKKYCKNCISVAESMGGKASSAAKKTTKIAAPITPTVHIAVPDSSTQPTEISDNVVFELVDMRTLCSHEVRKQHSKVMYEAWKQDKRYFLVFSDEWETKQELIRSMLQHRDGKDLVKLNARSLEVVVLTKQEEKIFFDLNHIGGNVPSKICFALKDKDGAIACALSLRLPVQKEKYPNTVEIARFASVMGGVVRGGFSKLLKQAEVWCIEQGFTNLISYAELRFGKGEVYLKNGFELLVENTGENYWYTDGTKRYFRFKFRAQPGKPELEVAREAGVWRVFGCGNRLYGKKLQ